MKNLWKTLTSTYAHENPWYKVRKDEVVRPDGTNGVYYVMEFGAGVAVIPITDDQKIILVEQFRYTTGRGGWELPAGAVEAGETVLAAAKRELQEETGFVADNWQELPHNFDLANGTTNATSYVCVARNLTATGQDDQAGEGIQNMQAFSLDEIKTMIREGKIVDGPAQAAIFQYILFSE